MRREAFVLTGTATVVMSLGLAFSPRPQMSGQQGPPLIPLDILANHAALVAIPMTGDEWTTITTWSDMTEAAAPGDNNSNHDVITLAAALRGLRENSFTYKDKALINELIIYDWQFPPDPTTLHPSFDVLAIGRNVLSYVLAADLIGLDTFDAAADTDFRNLLAQIKAQVWSCGRILRAIHELRPNNEGLVGGATRIAIDIYFGNYAALTDIKDAKKVFHAWLGNTALHGGFNYGTDLSWHLNTATPKGINPEGTKNGFDIGGVLPDDMRRLIDDPDTDCCSTMGDTFPTCYGKKTNYAWEGFQGAIMQAHLLARCGYSPFSWESAALDRAMDWLYVTYDFPPEDSVNGIACETPASTSDDTWIPFISDAYYGTSRAESSTAGGAPGKNCGFAAWWSKGI